MDHKLIFLHLNWNPSKFHVQEIGKQVLTLVTFVKIRQTIIFGILFTTLEANTVKLGYNDHGYNEQNVVVFLVPNEPLFYDSSQL